MTAPRPVLVFDGDCGFCTTSARFARRWVDRRERFAIQPWQSLDLGALGLDEQSCLDAAQFVRADGSVRSGHLAIADALRHGAAGWRPLGHLLRLPGVSRLGGIGYAWVARHRYQLPGGTPACALPTPTPAASTVPGVPAASTVPGVPAASTVPGVPTAPAAPAPTSPPTAPSPRNTPSNRQHRQ